MDLERHGFHGAAASFQRYGGAEFGIGGWGVEQSGSGSFSGFAQGGPGVSPKKFGAAAVSRIKADPGTYGYETLLPIDGDRGLDGVADNLQLCRRVFRRVDLRQDHAEFVAA